MQVITARKLFRTILRLKNLVAIPLLLLSLASCSILTGVNSIEEDKYYKGYTAYNDSDYAGALRAFTPLAEHGHAKSQYGLGLMYYYGYGVAQDYAAAAKWYGLAADQRLYYAQRKLASERGFAGAYANLDWTLLSWLMYKGKNGGAPKSKLIWTYWESFIIREQEDTNTRYNLYRSKNDTAPDYETALRELTPLGEQGDAAAQLNLGELYYNVGQDYRDAAAWYRLSAEQGNSEAQAKLSLIYFWGDGVQQDYIYAYMWGDIAAANGDENGAELRETAAAKMPPADIATAKTLGDECIDKNYKDCLPAVIYPDWHQSFYMGVFVYNGESAHALGELTLLAEQGGSDAQFKRGQTYRKGISIRQDNKIALKWFKLSAEQGNAETKNALVAMYLWGAGVPKDIKIAAQWLRFSAAQGNAGAQLTLGEMYFWGAGVQQDYLYAYMWGSISAFIGNRDGSIVRDTAARKMTPAQISAAQKLTRDCIAKEYKGC